MILREKRFGALCVIGALWWGEATVVTPARGNPVALWLFDEPPAGGSAVVPGKFGGALRPAASGTGELPRPESPLSRATDSRLNLGAHDWTIECWLKLDAAATEEGVVFEIGAGHAGGDELVTRWSVLPREQAFALASLGASPAGVAKRVEFPNPEGPPAGVAWLQTATLTSGGAKLPRDTWFHVALVHEVASQQLRLFLEGRLVAAAGAQIISLPRRNRAQVAIGRDGVGGRVLAGAIDELRVSDRAVYGENFTPPGSFAVATKARGER